MNAPQPAEQEVAATVETAAVEMPSPLPGSVTVHLPKNLAVPESPKQQEPARAIVPSIPIAKKALQYLNAYRWIVAGVLGAVILLGALVFVGMKFVFPPSKNLPLVFISGNELMLQASTKKDPITVSSQLLEDEAMKELDGSDYRMGIDKLVKLSDDGKRMYFVDRIKDTGGTLYYRDTRTSGSNSGDDDKRVKLATGLNQVGDELFEIPSSGDYAIYIRNFEDGKGGKLYMHNVKEETLLDKDVQYFWYSEEKSLVIYTRFDSNGKLDLYSKKIGKSDDRVKIDNEINGVELFSAKDGKVYYTKSDGKEYNALTLYRKDLDQSKVKMVSGVQQIVSSIDTDRFFYTISVSKDIALADLVDDDMAATDRSLKEPTESDYQTTVSVPQTDWWTNQTTYYNQIQTDYTAWYAAIDAYNAKQQRDQLRQSLQDEKVTDTSNDLYLFSDGKGTKLAGEYVYDMFHDPASKTIAYTKNDRGSMGKKKLTEISSVQDLRSEFDALVVQSKSTYLVAGGGKENEFYDGDTLIDKISVTDDGKTLYTIENKDSKKTFVSYDISGGKAANKKVIDEDVGAFTYIPGQPQLMYYKEMSDESGELYTLKDDVKTKISIDVKAWYSMYDPEDRMMLYLTDYDNKQGTGTLKMYKDGKETKLADEVGIYFYHGADKIYYLTNYDSQNGDGELMKYAKNNKSAKIADNVTAVLGGIFGYYF